ncbi:hypothetical protein ANN_05242 [Periplaneta americana]|uniref:Uncharacterized protein n=1 Tax=Periplaneta americana TaxID=6978 RepID=A0ABQ8TCB7_PERAM|nr:hypothetical protein ANN_05242 [Periplaneta americana]
MPVKAFPFDHSARHLSRKIASFAYFRDIGELHSKIFSEENYEKNSYRHRESNPGPLSCHTSRAKYNEEIWQPSRSDLRDSAVEIECVCAFNTPILCMFMVCVMEVPCVPSLNMNDAFRTEGYHIDESMELDERLGIAKEGGNERGANQPYFGCGIENSYVKLSLVMSAIHARAQQCIEAGGGTFENVRKHRPRRLEY